MTPTPPFFLDLKESSIASTCTRNFKETHWWPSTPNFCFGTSPTRTCTLPAIIRRRRLEIRMCHGLIFHDNGPFVRIQFSGLLDQNKRGTGTSVNISEPRTGCALRLLRFFNLCKVYRTPASTIIRGTILSLNDTGVWLNDAVYAPRLSGACLNAVYYLKPSLLYLTDYCPTSRDHASKTVNFHLQKDMYGSHLSLLRHSATARH